MEDIMKFKNFSILAICLLSVMHISGCLVIDLGGCSRKKVKGSGNVVSETRQVAEFDRIHLKGSGKVFLTRGEKPSIEVKPVPNNLKRLLDSGSSPE